MTQAATTAAGAARASATHAILYDADCGFCKWSLDKVLLWDRRGRLRPVAIQSPEGQGSCSRIFRPMGGWTRGTSSSRAGASCRAAPRRRRWRVCCPPGGRSPFCSRFSHAPPTAPTAGSPITATAWRAS